MKKIRIRMLAVGLLGLAMSAMFAGCRQEAPPGFERPPAPVSVIQAVSQDVPVYLDEVGKVAAREVVSIPEWSSQTSQIP